MAYGHARFSPSAGGHERSVPVNRCFRETSRHVHTVPTDEHRTSRLAYPGPGRPVSDMANLPQLRKVRTLDDCRPGQVSRIPRGYLWHPVLKVYVSRDVNAALNIRWLYNVAADDRGHFRRGQARLPTQETKARQGGDPFLQRARTTPPGPRYPHGAAWRARRHAQNDHAPASATPPPRPPPPQQQAPAPRARSSNQCELHVALRLQLQHAMVQRAALEASLPQPLTSIRAQVTEQVLVVVIRQMQLDTQRGGLQPRILRAERNTWQAHEGLWQQWQVHLQQREHHLAQLQQVLGQQQQQLRQQLAHHLGQQAQLQHLGQQLAQHLGQQQAQQQQQQPAQHHQHQGQHHQQQMAQQQQHQQQAMAMLPPDLAMQLQQQQYLAQQQQDLTQQLLHTRHCLAAVERLMHPAPQPQAGHPPGGVPVTELQAQAQQAISDYGTWLWQNAPNLDALRDTEWLDAAVMRIKESGDALKAACDELATQHRASQVQAVASLEALLVQLPGHQQPPGHQQQQPGQQQQQPGQQQQQPGQQQQQQQPADIGDSLDTILSCQVQLETELVGHLFPGVGAPQGDVDAQQVEQARLERAVLRLMFDHQADLAHRVACGPPLPPWGAPTDQLRLLAQQLELLAHMRAVERRQRAALAEHQAKSRLRRWGMEHERALSQLRRLQRAQRAAAAPGHPLHMPGSEQLRARARQQKELLERLHEQPGGALGAPRCQARRASNQWAQQLLALRKLARLPPL